MAGVGKTTALIALGHDERVREHFFDDILYVTLGAEVKEEHIVRELANITCVTGATSSANEVEETLEFRRAIRDAARWMQGKRILFLFDDVWPTALCVDGYLPKLRGILNGSPDHNEKQTCRRRHRFTCSLRCS